MATLIQIRRVSFKHLLADWFVIGAALMAALCLRVGPDNFSAYIWKALGYLPLLLLVRFITMIAFKCYAVMWRYISTIDAYRLAQAIAVSTSLIVLVTFFLSDSQLRLPRSVYIIEAFLSAFGLMGTRLYRRMLYEAESRSDVAGKRTLIYGAGQNGRLLAHRYKSDLSLNTYVVGFIDDDPKKADIVINGVPVVGDGKLLSHVIEHLKIKQVVVAMPKVGGQFLSQLVSATRPYNIRPRLTTGIHDHSSNKHSLEIVRDLNLSDLLNHPPRDIDLKSVNQIVRGKCVLVTGAGGSIGSELARQLMNYEPAKLLLLDHSEYNLYEIDKELRLATHDMQRVVPLMIDMKDNESLKIALRQHAPTVVFHAAAYKHVHLVETNPLPSILNNVGSTQNLLAMSLELNVDHFVMISTDKAVNPAGVMGATKRACELLITAAAKRSGKNYCSVRFGNVLGSSGSLIPSLKQQVESGGPITLTHPDMTRFFMLIPEAVSLVLKAASISHPGEINVLRMGEPIRIVDVAKSLIALMGRSEEEIQILFTGLRPGEKMFEELYIRGDERATEHPDILTLPNGDTDLTDDPAELLQIEKEVNAMIHLAKQGSLDAVKTLWSLVKSNYSSSDELSKDEGGIVYLPSRLN